MKFNKIGFIGLGLIGGSIARKVKNLNPAVKIIASSGRQTTIDAAYEMNLIDNNKKLSIEEFADCDLIFLCAPVEKNIEYLSSLKNVINKDCIITDVGSTKTEIHKSVIELELEGNFIGGHPMTGSEKTGLDNSNPLLLENAYYIITPTATSKEKDVEDFRTFVKALGSIPLVMDYKEHDYATASISHLPHVISFALTNLVQSIDDSKETMKTIAAGGFRDMTRIAASSPAMWESICLSNKEQIIDLSNQYIEELIKLKTLIENADSEGMLKYFQQAKDYRDSLAIPSHANSNSFYEIFVDLADETGGIAIIASLLAFNNISIKNIGIINNREFEEGVLRIEFYGLEDLKQASAVLNERNYKVYKRP